MFVQTGVAQGSSGPSHQASCRARTSLFYHRATRPGWRCKRTICLCDHRECPGVATDVPHPPQARHSQRRRRSRPNLSILMTPSPPRSFGLLISSQLIRQWPPFVSALPFQKKERRILPIRFLAQAARGKMERW
jgi:hypothetical protein